MALSSSNLRCLIFFGKFNSPNSITAKIYSKICVPNRKVTDDDEWQMVMSSHLAILARVLLLNQMVFIQVMQELNAPNPFETIIDVWLRKMPLIGQPEKRKLCSM